MMDNEISDWTGGCFVHSHLRIDDLLSEVGEGELDPSTMVYMSRYRDGSFSLRAITSYLEFALGKRVLVTDTQHPAYVLSDDYDRFTDDEKVQLFNVNVREATIDLLSACIIERMRIIRRFGEFAHVLSGVEADILSPKGELTVSNFGLSQLDYVTTSFHSSIWRAAGNPDLSRNGCIKMYNYVVDNSHVDAISHPILCIPTELKLSMTADDWIELFTHMREKQVAFEVNLDSTNLIYSRGKNLDRALVISTLKYCVPIVIGFDFHYLADWGCYPSPELLTSPENAIKLFHEHCANGSINRLLARILGNIYALKEIGFQPQDIVNSSEERFNTWLSGRNTRT